MVTHFSILGHARNRTLAVVAAGTLGLIGACSADSTKAAETDGGCEGGKCDDANGADGDFREVAGVAECVAALEAIPSTALHAQLRLDPDQEREVTDAVRVCLSEYIKINTSNPRRDDEPGETGAAHFFAGVFQHLDIPFTFTDLAGEPDPNRLTIVATLQGAQRDDSIILLSHTDVVRADGEWTHGPFSGHDDGEFVWGRGALDMKVISVMQLVSMSVIKRSGLQLDRDIHFVAAADEEVNGAGAEFVAMTDRDDDGNPVDVDPLDLRPGVVLNEGGTAIADALLPGRDVFLIGTEEKGLTWMQLAAPDPRELLQALVRTTITAPPPAAALPAADLSSQLAARCTLAGLISDEEQKTNVQPRQSTLTLDCEAGSKSLVEDALRPMESAIEPHPAVTISAEADGSRERIAIHVEQGAGGHGSSSNGATALDVALTAAVATGQVDPASLQADPGAHDRFFGFALSPSNQEFVSRLGRVVGPVTGSLTSWLTDQSWFVRPAGEHAGPMLPSEVPFRNTCSWTAFNFPVDGEARAKLDCRLIHQMNTSEFEGALLGFMREQNTVELRKDREDCFDCAIQEFNVSPIDAGATDYQILRSVTERSTPNAVVTPYLFPASSDSFFFRQLGVPTYGFMPASLPENLLRTFHAIDERFPIDQMFQSQKVYTETVAQMGLHIGPAPADAAHSLDTDIQCFERDDDLIGDDEWEATDEIECSVQRRSYYCVAGENTPRFIRVRAEDQDVRVRRVARLTDAFDDSVPIPPNDSPFVDRILFESRDADSPRLLKHRIFKGQEFELDTGTSAKRQFLIECQLPITLEPLDDSELQFYRD